MLRKLSLLKVGLKGLVASDGLTRRRELAVSRVSRHSRASLLFHDGAGLLLVALPTRRSPLEVRDGTIRYLVFDDLLCATEKLPAVIEFVEGHRAHWRELGCAPRCYVLVRVTEVHQSLRGSMANAGIVMLGRLKSGDLKAKARELEVLLPAPPPPDSLKPWPRPQGEPRPLTAAEQIIADEIVGVSRLGQDRDVD